MPLSGWLKEISGFNAWLHVIRAQKHWNAVFNQTLWKALYKETWTELIIQSKMIVI